MNKLKMSLALIALIIPLLLCAKKRNIEFIKHGNHRIPVESFIPEVHRERSEWCTSGRLYRPRECVTV